MSFRWAVDSTKNLHRCNMAKEIMDKFKQDTWYSINDTCKLLDSNSNRLVKEVLFTLAEESRLTSRKRNNWVTEFRV